MSKESGLHLRYYNIFLIVIYIRYIIFIYICVYWSTFQLMNIFANTLFYHSNLNWNYFICSLYNLIYLNLPLIWIWILSQQKSGVKLYYIIKWEKNVILLIFYKVRIHISTFQNDTRKPYLTHNISDTTIVWKKTTHWCWLVAWDGSCQPGAHWNALIYLFKRHT